MKKITLGVFTTRENAEEAVNTLHNELEIPTDDISYVYRNTDDEVQEIDADDIAKKTVLEGAQSGALTGGALGAVAGIATVVGIIPVIGPIFAAGPLISALGIGAGAIGTTAAAAATGAAAGGLIGALGTMGVSQANAKVYEDRVLAGDILVVAHADEKYDVGAVFAKHGATTIDSYTPTV